MDEAKKPGGLLLPAALIFAGALAVYAPAAPREYLWDDLAFVKTNAFVNDCSNLGAALNPLNLARVLPVPMSARPIVNATLLVDRCSGAGLRGMHFTNALLHAFNAVLLFLFIASLLGQAVPACFGALLFAVHPAAAEAVHIITFRSHLLGFFFFITGLCAALAHARSGSFRSGAAAAACYLAAMLSVETPVIFPAAALAVAWFRDGKQGLKKLLPLLAALACLCAFYLWFRAPRSGYLLPGIAAPGIAGASPLYPKLLFTGAPAAPTEYLPILPWRRIYADPAANFYTMARVLLDYFIALPLPLRLSADYAPAVISTFPEALAPLAADAGILAAAVLLFRRKRPEGLGLLLAITALLPVLNIRPLYNIKADRYLYLPLAGGALAAAAAYGRLAAAGRPLRSYAAAAAALCLGGLSFLALERNHEFKDNFSLFSAAAAVSPQSPRARFSLAGAYLARGNCPGAVKQLEAASGLDPENPGLKRYLAAVSAGCGSAVKVSGPEPVPARAAAPRRPARAPATSSARP
ncbi:MAG TPA: hypothetical protein PKI19_01990 [Elusimicrobiales bacterium]|nr:hypothetical protein [Elusimicrobiales bacterium]